MIRLVRLLLLAAIAGTVLPASAQTMYRCGSTFQDHPCGGGQAGQAIAPTHAADPGRAASGAPAISSLCTQFGVAAQKIMWKREAGKTQQDQAADDRGERDLIADVYARKGSSVEVRAAVERDCTNAEQQRAALAAAQMAAANKPGFGSGTSFAPVETRVDDTGATTPSAAAQPVRDNAAANAAASRKATCQQLNRQLDDIRDKQRAGGDVHVMESLRKQYRDTSDRASAAGC